MKINRYITVCDIPSGMFRPVEYAEKRITRHPVRDAFPTGCAMRGGIRPSAGRCVPDGIPFQILNH